VLPISPVADSAETSHRPPPLKPYITTTLVPPSLRARAELALHGPVRSHNPAGRLGCWLGRSSLVAMLAGLLQPRRHAGSVAAASSPSSSSFLHRTRSRSSWLAATCPRASCLHSNTSRHGDSGGVCCAEYLYHALGSSALEGDPVDAGQEWVLGFLSGGCGGSGQTRRHEHEHEHEHEHALRLAPPPSRSLLLSPQVSASPSSDFPPPPPTRPLLRLPSPSSDPPPPPTSRHLR